MKKTFLAIILILILLLIASPALAQSYQLTNPLAGIIGSEFSEKSIPQIIGTVIKAFLGIIGAIGLILFVYGGFIWLTSRGNTQKIDAGKKILVWTTIGIILVLSSYILIDFVIYALVGQSQPIAPPPYEEPEPLPPKPEITYECSDGKDNDGDKHIDFGTDFKKNDPGCESAEDDTEKSDCEVKFTEPNYCTKAGLRCVPCNLPNAEGLDQNCQKKAGSYARFVLGSKQETCASCVGTAIGCNAGEACCCLDCEVDKVQEKNCSQILESLNITPNITCP